MVSDHKALEYFMTTKALTARQARWAEVLSQFNFQIQYRPGATNRADALTRREQDYEKQLARRIAFRTQSLLRPEQLDPSIQQELPPAPIELSPIDSPALDLIDDLLRTNRTSPSLEELREKAKTNKDWALDNGLLKYKDRLVVADEELVMTCAPMCSKKSVQSGQYRGIDLRIRQDS